MPRKQRFKPSRKPKQPQPSGITDVQDISDGNGREPARPYPQTDVETGQPARPQADSPAVIETAGTDTQRA